METIKKGRPQKGWTKEYECTGAGNKGGGCGAILRISQRDLYKTVSEHWDGNTYYTSFTCHDCGVETDIPDPGVKLLGKRPKQKE
ncbi:MAG: hypothetical protein HY225_04285 [Candidatus Vogelbacteria bacterium]|nr:hypothetical protein [Candidatus Vogelbacteria bacterium]